MDNITINEDYIYQKFTELFPGFDMSVYSNIFCGYSKDYYTLQCYAVSPAEYNSVTVTPPTDVYIDRYWFSEKIHEYSFQINVKTVLVTVYTYFIRPKS